MTPVALVTGAGSGIGRASVVQLLELGWRVHALDLRRPEFADDRVTAHECDVTDEDALRAVSGSIGEIDGIVTAAGVNLRPQDAPVRYLERDAWDRTLAINLTGTMLTVRTFHANLREGGAITTIGSTAALAGTPGADAYTATKGAITALTRAWASDLSRYRIRVNSVCPGATDTPMMGDVLKHIDTDKFLTTPQHRFATPEEIAYVVAFTLQPQNSYMSGAIIPVDGGATAHLAGMPFPTVRTKSTSNLNRTDK